MLKNLKTIIFLGAISLLGVLCADEKDRMGILPNTTGFTPPDPMYSGYLPVSDTKALHYVFVHS